MLVEETWDWDVPLMPCRGYRSLSFLHSAAETLGQRANDGQRTVIYYFDDHDPSGVDIDRFVAVGIGECLASFAGWDELEPRGGVP